MSRPLGRIGRLLVHALAILAMLAMVAPGPAHAAAASHGTAPAMHPPGAALSDCADHAGATPATPDPGQAPADQHPAPPPGCCTGAACPAAAGGLPPSMARGTARATAQAMRPSVTRALAGRAIAPSPPPPRPAASA